MKSCTGSLIFLKARSAGYGFLDTVPVVEKISRVLRTVETSIFRLVAIALCVHPRICFCQTIRQRISSLYALDRSGSHDAIVTVRAQTCCLNLNIAHTQVRFLYVSGQELGNQQYKISSRHDFR